MKLFIDSNTQEMYDVLRELCNIPAPSHKEHKRAEYCMKKLKEYGAEGVYIDEALNVIFPLNCENSNEITVFAAHTDTVFPDTEPMPYYDDGEKIHSPGVSDDTASVVVLMLMAKYFIQNKLAPAKGIMFVCNSCEEGLGNLKGTRQLFKSYENRIARFISFDSSLNTVSDRCVGSHRYKVEVTTDGGHSFNDFGNENAIARLAEIVAGIYKTEVPVKEGVKTTYNVGEIVGGTSVNTIAQNAAMLCEYRSDNRECLDIMREKFEEIFASVRSDRVQVKVELIGERPCSNIDDALIEPLRKIVASVIKDVMGENPIYKSGSTDCNIPLSIGVPAICMGVNFHKGVHTREEYVDKKSMVTGLEMAIKAGIEFTEAQE